MTLPACFYTRLTRTATFTYCVQFRASGQESLPYPAYWTNDPREAELFESEGHPRLQELDSAWHSRQFDKLDQILQEIEDVTLKKRRQEETDEISETESN